MSFRAIQFALALLLFGAVVRGDVLIQEVVSRELSVHVGGIQTPEIREVVSREISFSVANGSEDSIHELISREISIVNTTPEPPPILSGLRATPSATGDRIALDWSTYNPWEVRDVARFDVYLLPTSGGSVTGLTPVMSVGGETLQATLDGLAPNIDRTVAVVAVDGLGNFNAEVHAVGVYLISREVVSRELTVFVGSDANSPYREVASREVSVLFSTPEPPPAVTGLRTRRSDTGESVALDWSTYNPWEVRDVARFEIYYADHLFTSVAGMTPVLSVGAESLTAVVNGLPRTGDHFLAVVPVDGGGQFISAVNAAGAYQFVGEVVSREVSMFVGDDSGHPMTSLVSREVSVVVPDADTPPPVTGIGGGFTAVTSVVRPRALDLNWSAYPEDDQRDVVRYRVYIRDSFFTTIDPEWPYQVSADGNRRATVDGLQSARIYYVAVVAEDALGNFNPSVQSVSAITTSALVLSVPTLTARVGLPLTYQVGVTEQDLTAYALRFELVSGPTGLTVGADGMLRWTPSALQSHRTHPVTVRVTDNGRPTASAEGQLLIAVEGDNAPPIANPDSFTRPNTETIAKIRLSALLSNDSDPDGDALSVLSVGNATPAGASVSIVGGWAVYVAPSKQAGNGQFSYTLWDGIGGHEVTTTVVVQEIGPDTSNAGAQPVFIGAEGADFRLKFVGVPGRMYRIQYATESAPPYLWREFVPAAIYQGSQGIDAGFFEHLDVNPPQSLRLYRAIPHAN